MTEPKQCSTCHWWYRYREPEADEINWGFCVLHTGLKDEKTEQVQFGNGRLKTRHDFGCLKYEKDMRA